MSGRSSESVEVGKYCVFISGNGRMEEEIGSRTGKMSRVIGALMNQC